jgi:hypothetical protein
MRIHHVLVAADPYARAEPPGFLVVRAENARHLFDQFAEQAVLVLQLAGLADGEQQVQQQADRGGAGHESISGRGGS